MHCASFKTFKNKFTPTMMIIIAIKYYYNHHQHHCTLIIFAFNIITTYINCTHHTVHFEYLMLQYINSIVDPQYSTCISNT